MRTLGAVILLLCLVVLLTPAAADAQDGKAAFLENKCNVCHTVESQQIEKTSKMAGTDLSDAGNMVESADWLKGFLLKENETAKGKHMKTWSGSEEQLQAIIGWLMGLKKS
jgi:mono/diheme cytochrome c family protein